MLQAFFRAVVLINHFFWQALRRPHFLGGVTMGAFLKLGDIKGEATDQGHKDWIIIESMSAPLHRTVPEGAKDQQRSRGHTVLGDVVVVRQLDKSSTKLQEACANGTYYKEAEIHFCTQVKNKQEPYLKYKLSDVIVTSYSFHGIESGNPLPSEQITMNCTGAEWTYVVVDPKTGDKKGDVPGKFSPGEGKS
jgi:type VI secretion system secreted protein Hcp